MLLLRGLAYVWASPNTLIGLVLGLLAFQRPRTARGILLFDGPPRGFTAVLRWFRRSAITYGHVVLSNRPVEGTLLAHELHHVWQYERLGPLYLPLYLLVWVFTGYRRHPFELAARLAESEG
ncbi:MAG TPA: hypothetical protein VHH92_02725 [Actinomycetota bacterium]|nr:hypothetical protein [Actinomycetota bacterium]